MTKKELLNKLEYLEFELKKLKLKSIEYDNPLTVENAKKRDYIVRTDYLGKLTHKELKEDFKKEIETTLCDLYKNVCNDILNYKFFNKATFKNVLEDYYKILKDYEIKQLVIDTYGEKSLKK